MLGGSRKQATKCFNLNLIYSKRPNCLAKEIEKGPEEEKQ